MINSAHKLYPYILGRISSPFRKAPSASHSKNPSPHCLCLHALSAPLLRYSPTEGESAYNLQTSLPYSSADRFEGGRPLYGLREECDR